MRTSAGPCGRWGAQRRPAAAALVPAHVPALWLWETANVLVQAERRGRISPAAIRTYLGLLEGLPISLDQPSTASAWHDTLALARSHRLTSYDAAYLELALRRGLPLATRDKALQAAARLEGVALLPC